MNNMLPTDYQNFIALSRYARWKDDVERMNKLMQREGMHGAVLEIFSPTRVNGVADKLGIVPGMSLDLTTVDPDDNKP
mgnify:CR=1 FL=1